MGGFSSLESVAVGGDVTFEGLSVNGEAGSFVKSFRLVVCFMVRSSGVYQGTELVNETNKLFQWARESEKMELSMMA